VAVLSDVWGRARLVVLGQGTLAAALLFTAWTSSPWGLTVGLAVAGASSGVACGAGQALLLESAGSGAERVTVRWSLYCAIGDVLTPLVTASAIALGHSYRAAMGAIGLGVALQCVLSASVLLRSRSTTLDRDRVLAAPVPRETEPAADPPLAALSRALRLPRLWAWLFAAASCTLLDELVIALSALRLEHDRGAPLALATAAAVTFSAGSLLGAAITDHVAEGWSSRRLLLWSATLCAVALVGLGASESALASCAALFLVGVTCAPHHPLALARAYDELPERPGTVQAMGQVFVAVDVAAPLALGFVADRFGLRSAIGCLLVQPIVVFACAALLGRGGEANRRERDAGPGAMP
jgi:MFS family permease